MHKPRRTRGASSLIQPIQGGRYACRREEQNQCHSMEEARLPILSESFGRRRGHTRGLVKAKSLLVAASRKGGGKTINGPPPQPTLPAIRHGIVALISRSSPRRCPYY